MVLKKFIWVVAGGERESSRVEKMAHKKAYYQVFAVEKKVKTHRHWR